MAPGAGQPAGRLAILALVGLFAVAIVGGAVLLWTPPASLPTISPLVFAHMLTAAGAILLVAGGKLYGEGYLAGIWLTSTLVPWSAAVGSVVVYVLMSGPGTTFGDRIVAVYVGLALALVVAAAGGFLGRALSWRDRAQTRTYDRLRDRYAQLRERYLQLIATADTVPEKRRGQFDTAVAEARSRLVAVHHELCDPSTGVPAVRWALATGYSNILRTLHRVEEMIIAAQPDAAAVGDALHDSLSLSDSTIAGRNDLAVHLASSVRVISPRAAATYFTPRAGPSPAALPETPSAAEAREVLREVRFAVNEFRDERVDGLIRARNRLVWVMLAVAISAYFTLCLALLFGVSTEALAAASVFYLVGAVTGLINRLRIESGRPSAVEDYGLYLARLIAVPVLSGLTAIGGVYLASKMPEFLGAITTDPPLPMKLEDIFSLARNELGLLVAATFGLVPAQLFAGLQRQAERFQTELEKSEPSGGSSLPGSGGG